jgi:hypothetical protein
MGLEASLSRNMDRYDGQEKIIRETAAKTTKRENKTCSQPGRWLYWPTNQAINKQWQR